MLEIKNYSYKYGNNTLFNDLSASFNQGQAYLLTGPNGSGKSTLLCSLSGLCLDYKGTITFNNKDIIKQDIDYKKNIAYVPENALLIGNLTGIQYLNFICDIYETPQSKRDKDMKKYFKIFNLTEVQNNLIKTYSPGLKQKLAIVIALIIQPKILLLDEPFSKMDNEAIINFKEILNSLKKKMLIIIASNDINQVKNLCDKALLIKKDDYKIVDYNKKIEKVYKEFING